MGLISWSRKKSPWIFHVNAASCNGCDIELVAALTPRYDVERLGVQLVPSPRHADVLVVTGTANSLMKERLKKIYEQMSEPKFVVAVGACTLGGGVYQGCYNVTHGVDKVIPVDLYIPGCPPRPEAIIYGILKLLGEAPEKELVESDSHGAREDIKA
jgi:NADH-quinone oxidoreductase B subunit